MFITRQQHTLAPLARRLAAAGTGSFTPGFYPPTPDAEEFSLTNGRFDAVVQHIGTPKPGDHPQQDVARMTALPLPPGAASVMNKDFISRHFSNTVDKAHDAVKLYTPEGGTTFAAAIIINDGILLACCGDSDIALFNGNHKVKGYIHDGKEPSIPGNGGRILKVDGSLESHNFPNVQPSKDATFIPFSRLEGGKLRLILTSDGVPLHQVEHLDEMLDRDMSATLMAQELIAETRLVQDNKTAIVVDINPENYKETLGFITIADGHGQQGRLAAQAATNAATTHFIAKAQEECAHLYPEISSGHTLG